MRRGQHGGNEEKLTDFDADIEEKQCDRDVTGGQANLAERSGEAEAMEKPEGKGDDPGRAGGDASLALARADDLSGDESDRQRDHRLDRRRRHMDEAKRRRASVMLCATVKAVIARTRWRVFGAIRISASTKRR